MHKTKEWETLSQKEREKLLRENGYSGLHNPSGGEIDKILKLRGNNSQNSTRYEQTQNDWTSSGPGDIPA